MANMLTMDVKENFDMTELTERLMERYQMQGYLVQKMKMKNGVNLIISKKLGGINTLLGLGEGITVTITNRNNSLNVTYSNSEWTSKIIGLGVGWILCFIPFITAIMGCIRQSGLDDKINNDIMMLVNEQDENNE